MVEYQDKEGKVLYGFSQENLAQTNDAIRRTNKYLQLLTVLFLVFLAITIYIIIWLNRNDVLTRMIYGG